MQDVRKDADSSMLTQSLIVAVFLLWSAHATPTGNHTCTGVIKHEVTVRVNVTEPVTFRAYEWCLRVPPRCSTYTIQLKDRVKIHKEMHNRTITVCCKGYVEIDYKCVPACPPETECPNMHCNRTNHCYCTPGYTGLYCNHPCPKGSWGAACIKPCDCPQGYTCHHLTGDCMIDDSPTQKTRRTTTADYWTEAATTLDTTHPITRTSTTVTTTQPTTTPTTTTIPTTTTTTAQTTTRTIPTTTTTTTTTTTSTTERPTTTTTTTTPAPETTPTPPPTELVTQPLPTTLATTTTEQATTTTERATTTTEQTTTEQVTTPQTKPTPTTVSTMKHILEEEIVTQTPLTTDPIFRQQEITTEKIAVQKILMTEAAEPITSTTITTLPTITESTTAGITTTAKQFPALITIPFQRETIKTIERKIDVMTSTTSLPISEQMTTTTTTEPRTSSTLKTSPTASSTPAPVQTTIPTTQLPSTTPTTTTTTTTTESAPTTITKSLHTEQIFITPPITFDLEKLTVQTSTSTEATAQPSEVTPTTTMATTTTEPTTQSTTRPTTKLTTTATTPSTTSRKTMVGVISTKTTSSFETAPNKEDEEALKTTTASEASLIEEKKLDVTKHLDVETKKDGQEGGSQQSVVRIGLTEQQIVTTPKSGLEIDTKDKGQVLKEGVEDEDKKLDRKSGEVHMTTITTTTDRLDGMIIEDIPKLLVPKPTTDNSPIKLVEEVISKYFPETLLKPNKTLNSNQDKIPVEEMPEIREKAVVTQWITKTREKASNRAKNAETTITLGTQEETKSHPRTEITTTTIPPPTTPDISTLPIITPKVIVSAKNPDEIDFGGVIYRKMKFFPATKQPEDLHKQTSPSANVAFNERSSPFKKTTTAIDDRFKIYLPDYEKSTEKVDRETTEVTTVRTFLPKINFDKDDFDYGKQSQTKKVKQKDKEVKKYKMKPNEPTAATSAEEGDSDRVTNNVFLQTREFKVHLATTKAAKFGDGFNTKSDQDSTDFGKFQKKKPKYGLPEYEPTKFVKYTVPPDSQDFEEGTRDGNFPTTNAKPPHTWYSHVREKAKIKNALKVMKSTIGLDLDVKPTEETALEESNDIHSMATQFTEREPRSAAVTYQEDLNNPQMFGKVKFNAPEGFLSSMADDGVKSGIFASVAVGGSCFVAMATLVAVVWLRLKGRARPRESSVSFEDGDVRNPVRMGHPNRVGDYETVYPTAGASDEMEVETFFCPTFTNNYAERINREFKEMSYDHPRPSVAEPLYAEILHPKIKDVVDQ